MYGISKGENTVLKQYGKGEVVLTNDLLDTLERMYGVDNLLVQVKRDGIPYLCKTTEVLVGETGLIFCYC